MGCAIRGNDKLLIVQPNQLLFNEPYKNNHFQLRQQVCNQLEFTDENFKRININLSKDQKKYQIQKNYNWKRLNQSTTNYNLCHDFKHTQIIQGKLKNDQFLNALRILSFQDMTIKKSLLTKNIKENSQCRLVLNLQGFWQEVIIDDYLPYNLKGQPLFSYYDGDDYWVQLIEKAFAKIYGCFEKLEQIDAAYEIIRDITGAPYLTLDEKDFSLKLQISIDKQYILYLINQQKEVFLYLNGEKSFLDLKRNARMLIQDKKNFQSIFIPFNSQYIQISEQIPISFKNQQVKYVVQMDLQQQCHTYITVSQKDLKFGSQIFYGQLHMIITEKNDNQLKPIYSKYQQVRDLTIECNLPNGQYLIYIEAFWQEQTADYTLNIQSYGSNQVLFKQFGKMEEKEKLGLLSEMIYHHSEDQSKTIYANDQLYSVKAQIGRYKYILFQNNTQDLTLKMNLQLKKHLVIINGPYIDQENQQVEILPNERKLLIFQILLENNDNHFFEVQEDYQVIGILTDNQLIEQVLSQPTEITHRNQYIKIYNYRLDNECGLVYVNNSEQKYIELNKVKLVNLSYKGNRNPESLNITVLPKQNFLVRFHKVDKSQEQYEFECNQQYKFE